MNFTKHPKENTTFHLSKISKNMNLIAANFPLPLIIRSSLTTSLFPPSPNNFLLVSLFLMLLLQSKLQPTKTNLMTDHLKASLLIIISWIAQKIN